MIGGGRLKSPREQLSGRPSQLTGKGSNKYHFEECLNQKLIEMCEWKEKSGEEVSECIYMLKDHQG